MSRLAIAGSVVLLGGCDLLKGSPICDNTAAPQSVAGTWVIEGNGTRQNCTDPNLNDDFSLGPSAALKILESAQPAPSTASDLLLMTLRATFQLTGEAQGNCVNFDTQEMTSLGSIHYSFQGAVERHDKVSGKFTGRGPGTCTASGDFSIQLTP
jgi:hypothetical protein